jgi:hypothetical protein
MAEGEEEKARGKHGVKRGQEGQANQTSGRVAW